VLILPSVGRYNILGMNTTKVSLKKMENGFGRSWLLCSSQFVRASMHAKCRPDCPPTIHQLTIAASKDFFSRSKDSTLMNDWREGITRNTHGSQSRRFCNPS
jgi:hypothetical protein